MLSHPLALPSGQGAFWASFPKAFHLYFPALSLWRLHVEIWSSIRVVRSSLFPPPAHWGAAGLSEPQRERLAMSKICQEKSHIPPPPPLHGFSCSSPWCCLDGRWWRPAALLVAGMLLAPLPEAGAVSPLVHPLGPEVNVLTQGRCLLINLPRDLHLSPSWLGWREPNAGGWRRLGALPSPACPGRRPGQSRIPHHRVQAH